MKLLISFIIVLLNSCSQKQTPPQYNPVAVPEALTDSKSDMSFVTKRHDNNSLVEDLYTELLGKDTSLKSLEDTYDNLSNKREDSLTLFNDFVSKNKEYYTEAESYISRIKDAVLKNHIGEIILKSKTSLESKLATHKSIVKQIDKTDSAIADFRTALIVVSTLKMMENYQTNNTPGIGSLQKSNQEFEKVLTEFKKKLSTY